MRCAMAKTNFTKVEGMLDDGLRKIMVDQLLDLADAQQEPKDKTLKTGPAKQNELRLKILITLQREMKILDKMKQDPYGLFNISKKKINEYIKNYEKLSDEEWGNIKETQNRVHQFRKEQKTNFNQNNDTDLIEQQRRSHKTKRFNINDKWLPLT